MVMSSHNPEDDYDLHDVPYNDSEGESTKPADPTLDVPPQMPGAGTAFQNLLGNAFFREEASLALYFPGETEPLIIQPPPQLALGRIENNSFEIPILDLVPYNAREGGVSRFHAVLHRSRRTLAIEDMDSTNGTYVNGQRLKAHELQVLHDGDEICLGRLIIQIQFQ